MMEIFFNADHFLSSESDYSLSLLHRDNNRAPGCLSVAEYGRPRHAHLPSAGGHHSHHRRHLHHHRRSCQQTVQSNQFIFLNQFTM